MNLFSFIILFFSLILFSIFLFSFLKSLIIKLLFIFCILLIFSFSTFSLSISFSFFITVIFLILFKLSLVKILLLFSVKILILILFIVGFIEWCFFSIKTSAILRGDLYILLRLIFILLLSILYKGEINISFLLLFFTKLISLFSLLLKLLSKLELFNALFSFVLVGDISFFIFCSCALVVYKDNSKSFAFSFFGILFWFFNNEFIKWCDSIKKFFLVFLFLLLLLSFIIILLRYELILLILRLLLISIVCIWCAFVLVLNESLIFSFFIWFNKSLFKIIFLFGILFTFIFFWSLFTFFIFLSKFCIKVFLSTKFKNFNLFWLKLWLVFNDIDSSLFWIPGIFLFLNDKFFLSKEFINFINFSFWKLIK